MVPFFFFLSIHTSSNVLVFLLDSCMEKLYKEETVLSLTKAWLQSTTQKYMANGALIVANFARSGM